MEKTSKIIKPSRQRIITMAAKPRPEKPKSKSNPCQPSTAAPWGLLETLGTRFFLCSSWKKQLGCGAVLLGVGLCSERISQRTHIKQNKSA